MRAFVPTLLALCVLISIEGVGAQTSPIKAPLVLSMSMPGGRAGRLHVALRNRSAKPVHVQLGSADNRTKSYYAISLLFVDAAGKTIPVVTLGYPMNGNIGTLNEVIAPGKEWNTDIELAEFATYDDPVNPAPIDHLPAGSYKVYGIFKGETGSGPPDGLPYWVGTVRSAPVPYVISK